MESEVQKWRGGQGADHVHVDVILDTVFDDARIDAAGHDQFTSVFLRLMGAG